MSNVVVRDSTEDDLGAITRIYAHEVLYSLASFESTPPSAVEMSRRRQSVLDQGFAYLVATIDEVVLGYAYAAPYRTRVAYQNTIENTVYVDNSARKQGIGVSLLTQLIVRCEQGPWRQMIAVIADFPTSGSVALHTKCGFRHVGTINAVGYKFNQWVDTIFMQRALNEGADTAPQKR